MNRESCVFDLRNAAISIGKGIQETGNGIRYVGFEITNTVSRIQEILSPEHKHFSPKLEVAINSKTGERKIHWRGYAKSVEDSMKRAEATARLFHNPRAARDSLNAQRRLWNEFEHRALNLSEGEAVSYITPKLIDAGDGVSFIQIKMFDGELIEECQLLPFKSAGEVQDFKDNLLRKQNISLEGDPRKNMAKLLFWIAEGPPIDFQKDLPQLISQTLGQQNINLFIRPNIWGDQRITSNSAGFGVYNNFSASSNLDKIEVSTEEHNNSQKIISGKQTLNNGIKTALTSTGTSAKTFIIETEIVSNSASETVIFAVAAATTVEITDQITRETLAVNTQKDPGNVVCLNNASRTQTALQNSDTDSASSSTSVVFKNTHRQKIEIKRTPDNKTIFIKPEPTIIEITLPVPAKENVAIEGNNLIIQETQKPARETVVYSYEKPADAIEVNITETGNGETGNNALCVRIPNEDKDAMIIPANDYTKTELETPAPVYISIGSNPDLKGEVKELYRRQLVVDIFLMMLKGSQLKKRDTSKLDEKNILEPVKQPNTDYIFDGIIIRPETEIERLEKDIKQDLTAPVQPKTKTRQKINIGFLTLVILLKIKNGFYKSKQQNQNYPAMETLLLFLINPKLFLVPANKALSI